MSFCKSNPADNEATNRKYKAITMLPIRASITECCYHLFHISIIGADLFHFEQKN